MVFKNEPVKLFKDPEFSGFFDCFITPVYTVILLIQLLLFFLPVPAFHLIDTLFDFTDDQRNDMEAVNDGLSIWKVRTRESKIRLIHI
jgi:hypothetical protein